MARGFIDECSIQIDDKAKDEIVNAKQSEEARAKKLGLPLPISPAVFGDSGVDYLSLPNMAAAIDKSEGTANKPDSLTVSAKRQVPIRNALMHGRSLTSQAKAEGHLAWMRITRKIIDLMEKQVKNRK